MRDHYHEMFLKAWWKVFYRFTVNFIILVFIWIFLFSNIKTISVEIYKPFAILLILFIINKLIEIKINLVEYSFQIMLIFDGISITLESMNFESFRFYEIWLIFYSIYLIMSIACCFHWKRMVIIFLFVQAFNFILIQRNYSNIQVHFYIGYVFISIFLPLVWMIIARILLEFLQTMKKNEELVITIKKIFQVFPEGIIIQSYDEKIKEYVVNFVNDTATQILINYKDPWDKPILDDKIDYLIKWISSNNNSNKNIKKKKSSIFLLSDMLKEHITSINENNSEIKNSIEIKFKDNNLNNSQILEHKCFNLKTVQVKLNNSSWSYIHVFVNTTTVKRLEAEKTRNELLQIMFSSVSHEFRTPINAFSNSVLILELNYNNFIQKSTELLPIELQNQLLSQRDKESNERFFKTWKVSTASLMSLIDDILDLAKIEAGTYKLNPKLFSIKTLIQDIDYIFNFQWTQKGITFRVDIDNQIIESTFLSDIGRIKQILMNLISNALKFTFEGEIWLSIDHFQEFDQTTFQRIRYLRFKVKDTGVGISDKEIPQLFKLFGMINIHRSRLNSKGTGLGLAISKKITESLGGTISLKSQLGSGTLVEFTIKENISN